MDVLKSVVVLSIITLVGCATHPSSVKPAKVDLINQSCEEIAKEVNDLYASQEVAFTGDTIMITLIGLPLMNSHEDELAVALGKWEHCK
jgi:starvation-inducible outer membrane lipoprotein